MTVSNTNGGVTVSSWSQAYLKVNGTVTARGFGSSPDAITFVESNSSGNIAFQAIFPASNFFFGASYSVDIHVYTPASAQFNTVQIVTVNGNLQVSIISTSSLTLTDTNGSVNLTCTLCGSATVTTTNGSVTIELSTLSLDGSYIVTSTNGNVSLTLPVLASCKIT